MVEYQHDAPVKVAALPGLRRDEELTSGRFTQLHASIVSAELP